MYQVSIYINPLNRTGVVPLGWFEVEGDYFGAEISSSDTDLTQDPGKRG